ncbi:MAG TPA: hypothetical protein VME24_02550 [Alphaproteobacteria bacterium]|nr:hypothetical protein [Alphaproteobacteria bacterium]
MITRIISGEPYRKATPVELRWYSAFFALFPLWGFFFVKAGHSYLEKAGGFGIWLYVMAAIGICVAWIWVWAKFVPATVSWALGGVIWITIVWLAFAGKLGP